MYPQDMVMPIKEELTSVGFKDCTTADQIKEAINAQGTTLVVINSVCGCAAANARPGAIQSLETDKKPDHLTTAFAGFDVEAVQEARQHMLPFPPSSPSIALFKDGQLVHMIERHHIEGVTPDDIAQNLIQAYREYC